MSIRLNPRSSLIPDPLISSHHGVRRLPRRGLPVSPRQVPHHAGRRSPRRRLSQTFVVGCAPRRAPPRASPPPPDVRRQVLRPAPALHRWIPVQRGQPPIAGSAPSRAPLHGTAAGSRPRGSPPPPVVAPPGILPPSKHPIAPSRLAHRCSVHRPSVGSSGQRIPPLLVSIVV